MSTNRYLSNSITGVLQTLVSTVITIISIPLFISELGLEGYGIFATLSVLGNINIFANLGLSTTLRKFLASQGKSEESNIDIIVSFGVISALALLISAFLYLFSDQIILNVLAVPSNKFHSAEQLFLYLVFSNLLLLLGQIFEAILDSQERIEITSVLRMLNNILYWGLIILALSLGYGLESVGFSIVIASIVWFSVLGLSARRIWGSLRCDITWDKLLIQLRKQVGFSSKVYMAGIVTIMGEPVIKILISNFLGIATVGFYEIGSRIRSYLASFLQKLVYPLFPILAKEKSLRKNAKMVITMELKILLVVLPIIICVTLLSEDFIGIWTRQSNSAVWRIMMGLVISYLLLNITIYPALIYFLSTNYPNIVIYYNLVYGALNILGLIFLSGSLNYYSIILSEIIALSIAFLLVIYYQKKIFVNLLVFVPKHLFVRFAMISFILLIIGSTVSFIITESLLKLILLPILVFSLFIVLLRYFHIFSEYEIDWLFSGSTTTKFWLKRFFIVGSKQE